MNKQLMLMIVVVLFCLPVFGQKISKPTLTPKPETEAQMELRRGCIRLRHGG